MEYLPYDPDLAPRDFSPFGRRKEQLKGKSFAEEENLLSVLSGFMNEIPPDVILSVFTGWARQPQRCLLVKKEYVE
jgi:hypothetical protein